MAIDVQELAVVMGVDNPDRVFKKHPVKAAQRARMFELVGRPMGLPSRSGSDVGQLCSSRGYS